jgi:hypothetical protein
VHDAHLARARWMTEVGWTLLLADDGPEPVHALQFSARRH